MNSFNNHKKPYSKDTPDFTFSDLVDIAELQQLVDYYSKIAGCAMAIIDVNGTVIVAAGWQKICTCFHRVHPQTKKYCRESDCFIKEKLKTDKPIDYKCKNGLWDVAFPVFIEDKHIVNIFIGQFFYDDEVIDFPFFEQQAEQYNFDKTEYLDAVKQVPLLSREKVKLLENFNVIFARILTKMGKSNLLLKKEKIEELGIANKQIKESEEKFKTLFKQSPIGLATFDLEGNLLECNYSCIAMFGINTVDEVIGINIFEDPNFTEQHKKEIKSGENVRFELKFDFDLVKKLNLYATKKSGLSFFSCFATTIKLDESGKKGILLQLIEITERKKAEFVLREENNRFTTTMNAIDAVIYVADMENHEILFTNNYVTNVFGNIVGKKCYAAIQGKSAPCDFCTNHLLLDAKGNVNPPYVWEFQNLITKRWYQCHDQAIQWTNGRLARFETATDITINKENEQTLKEHEIKLQELNATKDKFFSIIAHDLKNPFTVLKNGTYLLSKHLENNDLQKSKEKAQMISNATKNTYELLDNLLLWAKSQTGRTALDLKNISLTNSLSKNIKELENQASQKNISIINEVTDELILEADENLLSAVFRNLITNAIKFTHSGGKVTIQTKLTDNHIEIAVVDTGIGIPKEHHDKLFRLDVNYSRVGTANEASTSLGLILCKEFVEKHNGKIWFKSEVEKGSTFKVKLPVKQDKLSSSIS